jgi:ligand-binding sensor domain-containing protein/tRNA A-37 threonylcarbamoyl transferase component Bud32
MDTIQLGQQLGPYRIISQLGEGGMATVYKAYHAAMDRYVAIKVLPPEFARSPSFKGRFQQEARLIANLEHPHILPVHDVGEIDSVHFFVMRFLDAGTLSNRIAAGPIGLEEISQVFLQIVDALGYAHERGVIHRDIKPSNVMLDSRGSVFLTDFGIAKILEGTSKFTTTGAITGTPAYMSPEQAQGEPVDARSDIYSLGIVLYELITGRVPFEAETPLAVVLKHINAPLPPPSTIKPDIDPEIEKVVLKALAKDKADRYQTCQEFAAAWKRAYAQAAARVPTGAASPAKTQLVRNATTAPAVPPPPRRAGLPIWALAGGAAGLAVCVLGAVALAVAWPFISSRLASPVAMPATLQATGAPASPTGPVPSLPPATAAPSLPGHWQSWPGGNIVHKLVIDGNAVYTGGPGGVTVWDRAKASVVRHITTQDGLLDDQATDLALGADGALWIATTRGLARYANGALTVYTSELDDTTVNTVLRLHDGRILAGTAYSSKAGGGLNIFDGRHWSEAPDFPSTPGDSGTDLSSKVNALAESPDGTLWVGTERGIGRWDGSKWTVLGAKDGLPNESVQSLAVDRQGQVIVGMRAGVVLYDGQKFVLPEGTTQSQEAIFGAAQDAAGRYWVASGRGLYRYDPSTKAVQVWDNGHYSQLTYEVYGPAIAPDGQILVGTTGLGVVAFNADGPTAIWRIPNQPSGGAVQRILPVPGDRYWFVERWGVDLFDPATDSWRRWPDTYPGNLINVDAKGNLWASLSPAGVAVIPPDGTQTEYTEGQGFSADQTVSSVAFASDGSAWLGTSTGLAKFDGKTVSTVAAGQDMGLPTAVVRQVLAASDGSVWAAGEALLVRRKPDGSFERFSFGNPFHSDQVEVRSLREDSRGTIWIGTGGEGIYAYVGGHWTQYTQGDPDVTLESTTINGIAAGPDGSLWFATDNGLARFVDGKWTEYAAGPGSYMSAQIFDVYVNPAGVMYLATLGGLSQLTP